MSGFSLRHLRIIVLILALVVSTTTLACSITFPGLESEGERPPGEEWQEERPPEEEWQEEKPPEEEWGEERPPGEEWHEEPPPEEEWHEEPPPEEEWMPEEPPPEEPPPEESPPPEEPPPPEPPPPEPPPPPPPPEPTLEPPPGGGSWGVTTADIMPTDIYPGNQPYGQLWVRITNNGPDDLSNHPVEISIGGIRVDRISGKKDRYGGNVKTKIAVAKGQTVAVATGVSIDNKVFRYDTAQAILTVTDWNDPNTGNNTYNETGQPWQQ